MKVETLANHIAKNDLSQEDIEILLKKEIEPSLGSQYSKGYLCAIRHIKRRREARRARMDNEFKSILDFLSDLTHDKSFINQ